jgi:sec-independent protein translocase protein TatB
MLDVGWSELLLIGVVALIVIGPKDLPRVLREVGKFVRQAKNMAGQFRSGFDSMMQEAEIEELRRKTRETVESINPLSDFKNPLDDFKKPFEDIKDNVQTDAQTQGHTIAKSVPPSLAAVEADFLEQSSENYKQRPESAEQKIEQRSESMPKAQPEAVDMPTPKGAAV